MKKAFIYFLLALIPYTIFSYIYVYIVKIQYEDIPQHMVFFFFIVSLVIVFIVKKKIKNVENKEPKNINISNQAKHKVKFEEKHSNVSFTSTVKIGSEKKNKDCLKWEIVHRKTKRWKELGFGDGSLFPGYGQLYEREFEVWYCDVGSKEKKDVQRYYDKYPLNYGPKDCRKIVGDEISFEQLQNTKGYEGLFSGLDNIERKRWYFALIKKIPTGIETRRAVENEIVDEKIIQNRFNDIRELDISEHYSFYVIDIETANENNSSVCQIGIAGFNENDFKNAWGTYINPEDSFSGINIGIHGISSSDVKNSPTFTEVYNALKLLENKIVVQHTGFDKASIESVCKKYNLDILCYKWVDSALIAKRTWKDVSKRGFGLSDLSNKFKLKFVHHDAVEDAIMTGKIVLKAIGESGYSIADWVKLVKKPLKDFHN